MPRLVCAFVARKPGRQVFLRRGPIILNSNCLLSSSCMTKCPIDHVCAKSQHLHMAAQTSVSHKWLDSLKLCRHCNKDLNVYKRTLKLRHHIFALFLQTVYAIEKLLADFNVQPRIGMNQLLIWLHYHSMLLMTSHGYIQHPAPFCTAK